MREGSLAFLCVTAVCGTLLTGVSTDAGSGVAAEIGAVVDVGLAAGAVAVVPVAVGMAGGVVTAVFIGVVTLAVALVAAGGAAVVTGTDAWAVAVAGVVAGVGDAAFVCAAVVVVVGVGVGVGAAGEAEVKDFAAAEGIFEPVAAADTVPGILLDGREGAVDVADPAGCVAGNFSVAVPRCPGIGSDIVRTALEAGNSAGSGLTGRFAGSGPGTVRAG